MVTGSVNSRPLAGIALACGGYACFALQDAMVKWLVATYQVPQILFMRSLVIVVITGVLIRYRRHPSIFRSPYRNTIVLRAALMLGAWLLFYNAARHLELAELTTLYFSAPIMVMFLSILVLKEKIGPGRWIACAVGFVGVTVAANPTHSPNLIPAAMCIVAGFCWACSTILVRLVSRSETTMTQMYATGLLFGLACALSFPWTWQDPDLSGWLLMISLGLVSTLGQFLLYEGFAMHPPRRWRQWNIAGSSGPLSTVISSGRRFRQQMCLPVHSSSCWQACCSSPGSNGRQTCANAAPPVESPLQNSPCVAANGNLSPFRCSCTQKYIVLRYSKITIFAHTCRFWIQPLRRGRVTLEAMSNRFCGLPER